MIFMASLSPARSTYGLMEEVEGLVEEPLLLLVVGDEGGGPVGPQQRARHAAHLAEHKLLPHLEDALVRPRVLHQEDLLHVEAVQLHEPGRELKVS